MKEQAYLKNLVLYFVIVAVAVFVLVNSSSMDNRITLLDAFGIVGIVAIVGLGHLLAKRFSS